MASSQIEFVSSPFGCVLRDHNGRDRYRKSNCIQQNFKDFVHSCISVSPKDSENLKDSLAQIPRKKDDKWAKAREIVFEKEPSDASVGKSNSRAVSSIVKKWRDFEAGSKNLNLKNDNNGNSNSNNYVNSSSCTSRSNSGSISAENSQFLEVPIKNSEAPEATESVVERYEAPEESFVDSESSRESNATEKERIRVSDIIKKLKCGKGEECTEQSVTNVVLPKVRTSIPPEIKAFGPVVAASPRLRGRQAFTDLLMLMERDRHMELQSLGDRKAVSKFSHRGRIQAMLKIRFLPHVTQAKDGGRYNSTASERKKNSKGSSVMHLRDRFNTVVKQKAVGSSPPREVINHFKDLDKSSASTQLKEVVDHTPKTVNPSRSTQLKEVVDHTPKAGNPSTSTQLKEVVDHTPKVGNPSTSTQLKEVVDHTPKARNPSTSTQVKDDVICIPTKERPSTSNQLKEDIHPSVVTSHESPCKTTVDVTSNVEPSSTTSSSNTEPISTTDSLKVDVNQNPTVEYPSIFKSFKEIINSWQQTQPRTPCRNVVNDTLDVESCSTCDRVKVDINHHDVLAAQESTSELQNTETPYQEASSNLNALWQETNIETKSSESEKLVDNTKTMDEWKGKSEDLDANKQKLMVSLHEWIDENPLSKNCQEQPNREQVVETGPDCTSNFSQAPSEWEEDQSSYQLMDESNLDWIYDVSRPRSDWEYLRQERYQEMLDPFTDNGDIKQLLERKSVSSFLSSGLRDRIDQLMISRTQGQPNIIDNRVEQIDEKVAREEVKVEHEENEQEERGLKQYSEEEEEDESPVGRQYCQADEYSDTPSMSSASPDVFATWSRNQDNYASDGSAASPSLQQDLSFNSRNLENQQFPSFRSHHPSTEMELISDLRGHMEQLHKEIFDLRNSLQCCMDMQVKMQQCMMQQAVGFTSHSAQNRGTESINNMREKGTCCICHDAEVDSLLYRCGHMCTCFKCGYELQRDSGKCPTCQASILDVVRTYTDYR